MSVKASKSTDGRAFDYQFDLIKLEFELIDQSIRQHDEITKSIKNWAIVTWTASMGAAMSKPEFSENLWMVAFVPLLFWMVDGLFRRIQTTFIERSKRLAYEINTDEFKALAASGEAPRFAVMLLRVHSANRADWYRQYFRVLRYFSVSALYVGLAALTLFVWLILSENS